MNIAIIGSDGYIGSRLNEVLAALGNNLIRISQPYAANDYELRLKHPEKFDYKILKNCDYVIFTAAVSSPDVCAKQYESSYQVNVTGTKYFIKKVMELHCKVLFFSSDAVFGEDTGTPFNEDSQTVANSAYGIMKKEIEDFYKSITLFKAIRLPYVISPKDKFSSYILKCRQSRKVAEIYHPFYRSCTTIDDVSDSVLWLIKNWDEYDSTFLNVCGTELVSRIRIVDEINRISAEKIKYTIVQPPESFFSNRSKTTEMRSLYLNKVLKNWDEPFSNKIKRQFER